MGSNNGKVALLISAAATVVGLPVVFASLYNSWGLFLEARSSAERPARLPVDVPMEVVPEAPPPEVPIVAEPLKDMPLEHVVAGLLPEISVEGSRVEDYDPTLPYRLSLDAVNGLVTAATIDLGRDGTVDEWWTIRPTLGREVLRDGVRMRLVPRDGVWVPE